MEDEEESTQERPHRAPRTLTAEEISKIASDEPVSAFKQNKLEAEARKNWDLFYKRNETNFFKDRHWTKADLQQLCPDIDFQQRHVLFEAGCGVGNFLFPFLEEFPSWFAYACDFSARAIEFVRQRADFDEQRCSAFVCDLTSEGPSVPMESVDLCTLIFVLSSIHPEKMGGVLAALLGVLKPGASVIVRDYGLYDHAMLRFAKGRKLQEAFYARQDGTRAYFFSVDKLIETFAAAGFTALSCEYLERTTSNRKEGTSVPRTFIQGRFQKPFSSPNPS
uniref:tRNA N(3)-methylcytidine methyltransferase n=1 Tax=Plectus sambesii TaxID=2011161 RepID=A0A914UVN1_9BILA